MKKNIVNEQQFDKLLKAKVAEFVELNVVPFKKKYLELLQLGQDPTEFVTEVLKSNKTKKDYIPPRFIPVGEELLNLLFTEEAKIPTFYPTFFSFEQLVVTYNEYRNFEDDFVELLIQYLSEIVSVEEVVKYIANIISNLIKNQLILVGKISTLVELKELSEKGLLSLHSLSDNQLKQFYFELLDKEYTEDELAFTAKTFKDFILFRQIAKELQSRKQNKKED